MTDSRRALPSVSALLDSAGVRAMLETIPRSVVVSAARGALGALRANGGDLPASEDAWTRLVAERVTHVSRPSLRRVINATGVVLHTNLGRAPLAPAALEAIALAASGYDNLEYDLDRGTRGSRYVHCASLLRELTGAEDALVVNNCAAALVLALNTVSFGRDALLSRGELVEIGGSFRVHEIMEKSGARLREVGATNRTHVADYAKAIGSDTGAILKVHRSNFTVEGFVAEALVDDLVPLSREHDVPILHDLGSGLLISLERAGLTGETTAREALDAGASVVMMSGDKVLGGPQAGIILGQHRWIEQMRSNPLARSYRVDKLTLSALEATLALYRDHEVAWQGIPVLQLLGAGIDSLRDRAVHVSRALQDAGITCNVVDTTAAVGAGAFPRAELPSAAVALDGSAEQWAASLRSGEPAVVGRIVNNRFVLDVRAILESDVAELITCVVSARG